MNIMTQAYPVVSVVRPRSLIAIPVLGQTFVQVVSLATFSNIDINVTLVVIIVKHVRQKAIAKFALTDIHCQR